MAETLKLLAVLPHPDDESLGLGGALVRYAAAGIETYLVCATRGQRGWNGAEEENPGLAALGRIREAELRCAASQLGLHEFHLLDYMDGDIDQANPQEIITIIAAHLHSLVAIYKRGAAGGGRCQFPCAAPSAGTHSFKVLLCG